MGYCKTDLKRWNVLLQANHYWLFHYLYKGDKQRIYESYSLEDYDLFIDNLKYLMDNTESEKKNKFRVPKIPGLHASNEVNENQENPQEYGFWKHWNV